MSPRLLSILLQRSDLQVPWGFELIGGRDTQQPLFIGQVSPRSIASPYLSPGDEVLSLAGIAASRWSLATARAVVARPEKALELLIRKNSTSTGWTPARDYSVPITKPPPRPFFSPPPISTWMPPNQIARNLNKSSSGFWSTSSQARSSPSVTKSTTSVNGFISPAPSSIWSSGRNFSSNPNEINLSRSTTENSLSSQSSDFSFSSGFQSSENSLKKSSSANIQLNNFQPQNFEYSQTTTNVPNKIENSGKYILDGFNKSKTTNDIHNQNSPTLIKTTLKVPLNKNDYKLSNSTSFESSVNFPFNNTLQNNSTAPSLSPGFFRASDYSFTSEEDSNYSIDSSCSNYDSEVSNYSSNASYCTHRSYDSDSESTLDGSEETEFKYYSMDKSNNSLIPNSLQSFSTMNRSDSRTTFSSESGDSEFKFYSLGDSISSNSSISSLSRSQSQIGMSNSNILNSGNQERFDALRQRSNESVSKIRRFIFGPSDNIQAEDVLGFNRHSNFLINSTENCKSPPNFPPPPPPLPDLIDDSPASFKMKLKNNIRPPIYSPPPAIIQQTMLKQDKKPFSYTPGGGVDFARLREERLQRVQKAHQHFLTMKNSNKSQYPIQHSQSTPIKKISNW